MGWGDRDEAGWTYWPLQVVKPGSTGPHFEERMRNWSGDERMLDQKDVVFGIDNTSRDTASIRYRHARDGIGTSKILAMPRRAKSRAQVWFQAWTTTSLALLLFEVSVLCALYIYSCRPNEVSALVPTVFTSTLEKYIGRSVELGLWDGRI